MVDDDVHDRVGHHAAVGCGVGAFEDREQGVEPALAGGAGEPVLFGSLAELGTAVGNVALEL